jgi:hypothetical protein
MVRTIKQIAISTEHLFQRSGSWEVEPKLFALCEDGTLWTVDAEKLRGSSMADGQKMWLRLPGPPVA